MRPSTFVRRLASIAALVAVPLLLLRAGADEARSPAVPAPIAGAGAGAIGAAPGLEVASDAGAGLPAAARPDVAPLAASETTALLAMPGTTSTSIGGPNNGHVLGSVALPMHGPGFRFGPLRDPIARFGTVELVQTLVRAAAVVAASHPGSELTINDLGLAGGGPIPHHGSHRAGRDVDVLFFLLEANGAPRPGIGAPIEPNGTGTDYGDLAVAEDDVVVRIDLARSWAFVEATLRDERADVQRIFLVEHVRSMLLEHAASVLADPAIVSRFADLTCQPEYPHDDHFHFRFFCTAEDIRAGCTDSAPIFPWQREKLAREGVAPMLQTRTPVEPESRSPPRGHATAASTVTTEAEARATAGPMHPEVVAFLARRDAWRRQPHPGRRYCR